MAHLDVPGKEHKVRASGTGPWCLCSLPCTEKTKR